jgi:hypothetical protein
MTEEYKYNCEKCNYHSNRKDGFLQHKRTKKHKKNHELELELNQNTKNNKKYHCEYCNYHTNNKVGLYQHKRTKKHKKNVEENTLIYNCEICNYGTNNQTEFITHHNDKHTKKEDLDKISNMINSNNTINNNTINNITNNNQRILNIHLHNDKETYKLMLGSLSNDKFLNLLGGVNNKSDFRENELWDERELRKHFISNIIDKTLENKKSNKSIKNIKMSRSDRRNNIIQLKDEEKEKFNKYDSDLVLGNLLENNLKLTKEEHIDRIKTNKGNYIQYLILMTEFSKMVNFKKGYQYNFVDIIQKIIDNTEQSLNYIKYNNLDEELELEENIENYKYLLNCFKEMKKKLEMLTNNEN